MIKFRLGDRVQYTQHARDTWLRKDMDVVGTVTTKHWKRVIYVSVRWDGNTWPSGPYAVSYIEHIPERKL